MAQSLVRVVDRSNGNVLWSGNIDFTEPRSMIAVNSGSGTAFKRVQPGDATVNIYIGENITAASFAETRK